MSNSPYLQFPSPGVPPSRNDGTQPHQPFNGQAGVGSMPMNFAGYSDLPGGEYHSSGAPGNQPLDLQQLLAGQGFNGEKSQSDGPNGQQIDEDLQNLLSVDDPDQAAKNAAANLPLLKAVLDSIASRPAPMQQQQMPMVWYPYYGWVPNPYQGIQPQMNTLPMPTFNQITDGMRPQTPTPQGMPKNRISAVEQRQDSISSIKENTSLARSTSQKQNSFARSPLVMSPDGSISAKPETNRLTNPVDVQQEEEYEDISPVESGSDGYNNAPTSGDWGISPVNASDTTLLPSRSLSVRELEAELESMQDSRVKMGQQYLDESISPVQQRVMGKPGQADVSLTNHLDQQESSGGNRKAELSFRDRPEPNSTSEQQDRGYPDNDDSPFHDISESNPFDDSQRSNSQGRIGSYGASPRMPNYAKSPEVQRSLSNSSRGPQTPSSSTLFGSRLMANESTRGLGLSQSTTTSDRDLSASKPAKKVANARANSSTSTSFSHTVKQPENHKSATPTHVSNKAYSKHIPHSRSTLSPSSATLAPKTATRGGSGTGISLPTSPRPGPSLPLSPRPSQQANHQPPASRPAKGAPALSAQPSSSSDRVKSYVRVRPNAGPTNTKESAKLAEPPIPRMPSVLRPGHASMGKRFSEIPDDGIPLTPATNKAPPYPRTGNSQRVRKSTTAKGEMNGYPHSDDNDDILNGYLR